MDQTWQPGNDIGNKTLGEVYETMHGDSQGKVPFAIWLFENPKSPIAIPGHINLFNHDCVHIILGKGVSIPGEAFVIGYCMGNSTKTRWYHVGMFKFVSKYLYPRKDRIPTEIFRGHFWSGFSCGKLSKSKNINEVEFAKFLRRKIDSLRHEFGLSQFIQEL